MSNKWILISYAIVFFMVVSSFDLYSSNIYLVVLAAAALSIGGVVAWVMSVQPKKKDD